MNYTINCADKTAECRVDLISCVDGIEQYRISIKYPKKTIPAPVTFAWEEDMKNSFAFWSPTAGRARGLNQWWHANNNISRFCFGAPVMCVVGENDMNNITVAVADADTPIDMTFGIEDFKQEEKSGCKIIFFNGNCDKIQEYSTVIYIDRRAIPYYESTMAVYGFWRDNGYKFPECPDAAEDALYSSWYNFHQSPEQKALEEDLEIAAKLGFKTVILDDGWQFDGVAVGDYATCGDWKVAPGKFPDFKKFSDRVHSLGMKLMVWFNVPFVGEQSSVYDRFTGKYLYLEKGMGVGVLDPRYPEVRDYIVGVYAKFLKDYGIDGFKLDFIDSFRPGNLTAEYDPDTMDCETVDGGVIRLLSQIRDTLSEIKPDLLFEYRQNYVGASINRFGNMLRVADCAYDSVTNRIGAADLRLLNYPIAVHSDMLFWAHDEKPLLCARQLLNIMFSVPQISVILGRITDEQRKLVGAFVKYWTENRDILLHGYFTAKQPGMNYTYISSESDTKRISVIHTNQSVTLDSKLQDVFNNSDSQRIAVENTSGKTLNIKIYDHLYEEIGQEQLRPNQVKMINIPLCGRIGC